jgi:hypothetical protein
MNKQVPKSVMQFGGDVIGICKSYKVGTMSEEDLLLELESAMDVVKAKLVLYRKGLYCVKCNNINTLCNCKSHVNNPI